MIFGVLVGVSREECGQIRVVAGARVVFRGANFWLDGLDMTITK